MPTHLTETDLLAYFEGNLDKRKLYAVQQHLNSCRECFQLCIAYRKSVKNLQEADDLTQTMAIPKLSVEKQLERLVQEGEIDAGLQTAPAPNHETISAAGWLQSLSRFRPAWPQLAVAAVLVFCVIFLGTPQYFAWRSDALTEDGLAAFVETYPQVDRDAPRMSGDFQLSVLAATRSLQDTANQAILAKFQRAIDYDKKNVDAIAHLGGYYFRAERNVHRAQAILMRGFAIDSTNVHVLINLGVVAWQQEQRNQAISYFRRALSHDPNNQTALYNVALVLQEQGDVEAAITAWQRFLDNAQGDSNWVKSASQHLENLKHVQ